MVTLLACPLPDHIQVLRLQSLLPMLAIEDSCLESDGHPDQKGSSKPWAFYCRFHTPTEVW